MTFKYELGSEASIKASDESGTVIGRAEYLSGENSYLVRYKAADGRAVQVWWEESALA